MRIAQDHPMLSGFYPYSLDSTIDAFDLRRLAIHCRTPPGVIGVSDNKQRAGFGTHLDFDECWLVAKYANSTCERPGRIAVSGRNTRYVEIPFTDRTFVSARPHGCLASAGDGHEAMGDVETRGQRFARVDIHF